MVRTNQHILKTGDRVMVTTTHPWMPERCGSVKKIQTRIGNRIIVKFDNDELGMWHDDEGDPVLRLDEKDLILLEQRLSLAA